MGEWFKKFFSTVKEQWGKWTIVQRGILAAIVVGVIAGIVFLFSLSSAPTMVPLINAPITDQSVRERILLRLDEENVQATVSSANIIMVKDEQTARRLRPILIREDLIPKNTSPWAIFDVDRWSARQFTDDINLRRAIELQIKQHIEALDDIDSANVVITVPEKALFASEQEPVKASVVLYTAPGSDMLNNRKKIEGVQKLILMAVDGLTVSNLAILDSNGNQINDFEGMEKIDALTITEKQQKHIAALEAQYRVKILNALQEIYTSDRVRDLNVKIDMDMSKKQVKTEEFFPVTVKERTPGLPYDDSEQAMSITRSSQTSTTRWQGTGFNPEGPAGVEGQTAPAYKDQSNLYGLTEQSTVTKNEEVNRRDIVEEKSPTIDRVTVSVNIDGTWKYKYDEKGTRIVNPDGSMEREYTPIPQDELKKVESLVQNAVGYQASRGDSVSVQNIQFDRSKEFTEEDEAYLRKQQMQRTILYIVIALTVVLVLVIMFKLIAREAERRRRIKEEEMLRQHQLARERAILEAEQSGMDVTMSVEERRRIELQENAINMAKEHPEDVAMLIRTWLTEE